MWLKSQILRSMKEFLFQKVQKHSQVSVSLALEIRNFGIVETMEELSISINANVQLPLEKEVTSNKEEEVQAENALQKDQDESPLAPEINNSIAMAIFSDESKKQILKEQSEVITLAILKQREVESTNQVTQKQKLIEDLKNENEAVKKKLAIFVEKRKMFKEQVEADENIVKHFMDYIHRLQRDSKGFVEKQSRFGKKFKELNDKVGKLQEITATIAAYKKRYEDIEKKKTVVKRVKDGSSPIQEEIIKMQTEIAKMKNICDDEAVNIQKLTDEKIELFKTLLSKNEQLTDIKNKISNEERKLDIMKTLHLAAEQKNAKLKEIELNISKYDEEIVLLGKQNEGNSIVLNDKQITVQNLKESMDLIKSKVEIAQSAMKNATQKTSEDIKVSEDRYGALEKDLMKLNEETKEKNKILQKSNIDLLRLMEEKNSLQTQQLNKQKNKEIRRIRKLHLESRKEYLRVILESRQKLNKQHEELILHSATSLLKMNREKEYLNANIHYTNDLQSTLNYQTDKLKARLVKLEKDKEMGDKSIAEKHKKIERLKKLMQRGEYVRPGILKKTPTSTATRIRFERRLSDSSTTDSSQTSELQTPAEKLFDQLKKNENK